MFYPLQSVYAKAKNSLTGSADRHGYMDVGQLLPPLLLLYTHTSCNLCMYYSDSATPIILGCTLDTN